MLLFFPLCFLWAFILPNYLWHREVFLKPFLPLLQGDHITLITLVIGELHNHKYRLKTHATGQWNTVTFSILTFWVSSWNIIFYVFIWRYSPLCKLLTKTAATIVQFIMCIWQLGPCQWMLLLGWMLYNLSTSFTFSAFKTTWILYDKLQDSVFHWIMESWNWKVFL